MKIGFIGTGLMGLPMAKNLLKSGFKLKAFNRSISKAEPLIEFGAEISKTLGEVVKDNDFIITMLTDDSAVDPDFKLSNNSEWLIIASTAISSVNIVIIKLLSLTTSPKLYDISAPNSFKGSALLIDLLNTFNLIPDFNKFFAIGKP